MGVDISLTGIPDFDKLELVKIGSIQTTQLIIANPGAGIYSTGTNFDDLAHNLGYLPVILGYEDRGGLAENLQLPYVFYSGFSSAALWVSVRISVDNVNVLVERNALVYGQGYTSAAPIIKFFLFRTRASS